MSLRKRLSFARVLAVVLTVSFVAGFATFVASGATTDRGTTGAIASEYATIMRAEQTRCARFGTYASLRTLEHERLLDGAPLYNSVVYLPGRGCGTIVVGSPAYQSSAG